MVPQMLDMAKVFVLVKLMLPLYTLAQGNTGRYNSILNTIKLLNIIHFIVLVIKSLVNNTSLPF